MQKPTSYCRKVCLSAGYGFRPNVLVFAEHLLSASAVTVLVDLSCLPAKCNGEAPKVAVPIHKAHRPLEVHAHRGGQALRGHGEDPQLDEYRGDADQVDAVVQFDQPQDTAAASVARHPGVQFNRQ